MSIFEITPYVEKRSNITDPWGEEYLYKMHAENGANDVYSYGVDGQSGGGYQGTF